MPQLMRRNSLKTLAVMVNSSSESCFDMSSDSNFAELLKNYFPERLLTSEDTIYGLRPDLTLSYFNEGWTQFARDNGGEPAISRDWPIGRNFQEAIPLELRPFFEVHFEKCLDEHCPWDHQYDCSSPSKCRRFLMRAYPLKSGQGILVVNSPIYESGSNCEASEIDEEQYRTAEGLIIQCCHCRRIRRRSTKKAWDKISEWATHFPRNTSHGVCEPCFGHFYGK